jgi:hypothetical protein
MPVVSGSQDVRQEDHEFEAGHAKLGRPYLKNKSKRAGDTAQVIGGPGFNPGYY